MPAEGEKEQDKPTSAADTAATKSIQGTLKALLANLILDSMKALRAKVEEALSKARAVL